MTLTKREVQEIISEKIITMRLERAKQESEDELIRFAYLMFFIGGFFAGLILIGLITY